MLSVKSFKTIHEINAQEWDSILTSDDMFHRHHFVAVVEDSRVEDADFYYRLFYDGDTLVATAVLSAFKLSLDLFISNNGFVKKIKEHFPDFFSIKILVCGLPASFGQSNLKIKENQYADEVCMAIPQQMKQLAKELRIKFMAIKELRKEEMERLEAVEKQGFFLANSIPYMNLDVCWKSFDNYLDSLRHNYRRRILISLKKINKQRPVVIPITQYDATDPAPALVLADPDPAFAAAFNKLYLSVMERTATKLETLNETFFTNLFSCGRRYKLLNLVVSGEIISSALLIAGDNTITFMLVGKENEKDKYDSYFNLVYGMIEYAIRSNAKKIKLGQTAYWVKQRVGGVPENEYIFFASRSFFWHTLLKRFNRLVFPELILKSIKVFKNKAEKTRPLNLMNKSKGQEPETTYAAR